MDDVAPPREAEPPAETIRSLARLRGLPMTDEDLRAVASMFAFYAAGINRLGRLVVPTRSPHAAWMPISEHNDLDDPA
jgi:hypothetical protein